jgi:hypothetical protein
MVMPHQTRTLNGISSVLLWHHNRHFNVAGSDVLLPARYVPQVDLTLNGGQKAEIEKEALGQPR